MGDPGPEAHPAPDGLLDAFWRYERALNTNDLAELDQLFAPGDDTIRSDASGILVGHERISAFRRGRGGIGPRRIAAVHVHAIDADAATIIADTRPESGGAGVQTQLWRRHEGAWRIAVAHVSSTPPVLDGSVWRVAGTPLVAGSGGGPLTGQTVAVKDLFDVAGFAVGAGVPEWLAAAPRAESHAPAVAALLEAGADVVGIARTDEFAYSIAGANEHYGSAPNPAVPGGLPGGSTSGPGAAVALGQASIGLGTDTAGSIRVPASYQGLWGLRTTHGRISRAGLLALAPSFDSVGWLTRDASTLLAVVRSMLDGVGSEDASPDDERSAPTVAVLDLDGLDLDTPVLAAFAQGIDCLADAGIEVEGAPVRLPLAGIATAFRAVQSFEAWQQHGAWIEAHPAALGAEVAARFRAASTVTSEHVDAARADLAASVRTIEEVLGDRLLVLPSTASAAPARTSPVEAIERTRTATLRLTTLASATGRPALSIPLVTVATGTTPRAPFGIGVVGPRGSDLRLVRDFARSERRSR